MVRATAFWIDLFLLHDETWLLSYFRVVCALCAASWLMPCVFCAAEIESLARKLSSGLNTPVAESTLPSGESGRASPVTSRIHFSGVGTGDVTNEPTRCYLRFRVVDSGIGIDEKTAAAVTAEVKSADDLGVESIKGSGAFSLCGCAVCDVVGLIVLVVCL